MMTQPDTTTPSNLEIWLFGPLNLRVNGTSVTRSCMRKARHLLALLALRTGHEVERAWLAGTLWPESAERQAHSNLREVLHHLRQVLAEESPRLLSPTRRTLCLELTEAQVDVLAFDAAIRRGDSVSLERAVALYRGPLLEDCLEEWVLLERQQREQAYLQAREQLAEAALQAGDAAGAGVHLRSVIGVDPLREGAQRGLMQALADGGDYAAAVQVYRQLRLLLHRELHTEPDPQTTALFEQLRARARYQAQVVRSTPVPTAPTAPAPIRLPKPVSGLIGREQEIEEVSASLSAVRLLTLTGAGGVGKTRLAIATAEAVADDYPDGVCFVDLAPLSDPALIPHSVASVLEVREEPGRALLETLSGALRSKALLLVLDNCEHLLEGCIPLVAALLQSGKRLKILTTSRQSLGITGELVWRVPSLSVPPVHATPIVEKEPVGVWLEYAAVQLFVARAQLIAPAFRLSQANAGSVVQICQQLDGIPLALELAAARLLAMSVEQIASRLSDRFGLLRGGSRADLPRQQTLQAMLDWSYELLTQKERLLLGRLSVFASGWALEAAESVCADEQVEAFEVLDLLVSLVDKSLVIAEERAGRSRYHLLETIRAYGRERLLEREEETRWCARHLAYFLALAEEAEPHLTGPLQAEWMERLKAEQDNLRAALRWSEHDKESGEAGLRLAGALWRFWGIHGNWSEGREHLRTALSQDDLPPGSPARAKALNGAGNLAEHQGDYAEARALHEQSLAISQELGDKRGIASSLNNLGLVAQWQGDYAAARTLYEQSLAIDRDMGDQWGIACALNNLGNVAREQGDDATARTLYEDSLAIRRELGDKGCIAISLHCIGYVAWRQGDYTTAQTLHEDSLAIRRELGDKSGIAVSLHCLGLVAKERGDYRLARALFEECLALFKELGDRGDFAVSLNCLGMVALNTGDPAAARARCEESLAIRRELGDKQGIAESMESLASLAAAQGQMQRASRLWAAAQALREAIGSPLPPNEREKHDRNLAIVREALGESAFAIAWEQGQAMTIEQAMAYTLSNGEAIQPGSD